MHVTLSCVIEAKQCQFEPVAALCQVPTADSAQNQRTDVVKHTVPGTSHVVDIYTDTEPADEEVAVGTTQRWQWSSIANIWSVCRQRGSRIFGCVAPKVCRPWIPMSVTVWAIKRCSPW